jgi:hypothetical protein
MVAGITGAASTRRGVSLALVHGFVPGVDRLWRNMWTV